MAISETKGGKTQLTVLNVA